MEEDREGDRGDWNGKLAKTKGRGSLGKLRQWEEQQQKVFFDLF